MQGLSWANCLQEPKCQSSSNVKGVPLATAHITPYSISWHREEGIKGKESKEVGASDYLTTTSTYYDSRVILINCFLSLPER